MLDIDFQYEPTSSGEANQAIATAQAELAGWQRVFLGVGAVGVVALLVANGALARAIAAAILGIGCVGYAYGYGTKRLRMRLEDLRPLTPAEVHELASLATSHEGIRSAVAQWLSTGETLRVQDLAAAKTFYERWDTETAQDRAMAVLQGGVSAHNRHEA